MNANDYKDASAQPLSVTTALDRSAGRSVYQNGSDKEPGSISDRHATRSISCCRGDSESARLSIIGTTQPGMINFADGVPERLMYLGIG